MNHLLYIPQLFGFSIEVYFIIIIIGIVTFFFWHWLFKKLITDSKKRKIATWLTTIFVTPFIYVLIILAFVFSASYYPTHDFNKQKWVSDSEKRYELSGDIIDSKILIGKTKKEVIEILGEPDGWKEEDYWSYYLGFKPGLFGIDPDYLDIKFRNNKVITVGQHES
jgi:hypothetical protein